MYLTKVWCLAILMKSKKNLNYYKEKNMNRKIINAIKNQIVIKFAYEGKSRIVEPHCYGLTMKGNEAIRAYQIDGYSSSEEMGWKLYDLSKANNIEMLDDTFEVRDGYRKGDKGMSKIFAEI